MKRLLLVLVLMSSVGCVLPGDLDELRLAQAAYARGEITAEELGTVEDRVVSGAADRTTETIDGLLELFETLGVPGLFTAVGAWGLNRYRNSNRKKRGEVV